MSTSDQVENSTVSKNTQKKKFRYYGTYISKVLKSVAPDSGITASARNQVNSILITLSKRFTDIALELTSISHRKTMSIRELEKAVRLILKGDLMKHSLKEGEKAIKNFSNNRKSAEGAKGTSRQAKANIIFPPSISEKFLRRFDTSNVMVTYNSPIYLAAVLEYISMEILDMASQQAKDNKKIRITSKDLELGVRYDSELNQLITETNIEFIGGARVPYIHPFLLKKKPTRRKKKVKDKDKDKERVHRFKPGTVAIRDIRKYQKMGNKIILAKNPFEKYVRSILSEYKDKVKISKSVLKILQYYIEQHLVDTLSYANAAAIHANRVKLISADIEFVCSIQEKKIFIENKVKELLSVEQNKDSHFVHDSDIEESEGVERSEEESEGEESEGEESKGEESEGEESEGEESEGEESEGEESEGEESEGEESEGEESEGEESEGEED